MRAGNVLMQAARRSINLHRDSPEASHLDEGQVPDDGERGAVDTGGAVYVDALAERVLQRVQHAHRLGQHQRLQQDAEQGSKTHLEATVHCDDAVML